MSPVTLSDGVHVPILGLGVFQITDQHECKRCVSTHLRPADEIRTFEFRQSLVAYHRDPTMVEPLGTCKIGTYII